MSDLRYALRALRQRPGFAAVAMVTLALGIGANTAMFSLVNAVLVRPLPYARPDRLVQVFETHPSDVSDRTEASYPDFLDWRREPGLFAALEGYDPTNVSVSGPDGAERVNGIRVTSGFLSMLGVAPLRGAGFTALDDVPGGTPAVMLSHGYWTRRFGADPAVVGRTVTIDGTPYQIRGVLPPRFHFAPAGNVDLWFPLGRSGDTRAQRFNRWVSTVGRLRDGVTVERAGAGMNQVMGTLAAEYPETNRGRGATVTRLRDVVTGDVERPLLVLFGAVALVLAIVCANVASLFLARSLERGHEIAVRMSLGASRGRIVRQLLVESLVLALAGAALGTWLATQAVPLLIAALPAGLFEQMPALRDASVDLTVLGFTASLAAATGIAAGLAPALLVSGRPAAEWLRADTRAGGGRARRRVRDTLVTAEIALTLVLLVGAALMAKSLIALLDVDPGFAPERVATMRVALAGPAYAEGERQKQFFEDLLARLRALPGVQEVGAISSAPLQGTGPNILRVDGAPQPDPGARPEASARAVAGDYFQALRIPLLRGRVLDARDARDAPYAVVISQGLAGRLFGSGPAVGRRIRFYGWEDRPWTVVGVVGDVKTNALDEPAVPSVYYYHLQGPANRMSIVARGANAAALVPLMRRAVAAADPNVLVYWPGTMEQYIAGSPAVASRQYLLTLLGVFALAALLLAIMGVYGVIAYAVTQRHREITIRLALGANGAQVLKLLLGDGLRVALAGIGVGAVAAFAGMRALSTLLFGVSPVDVWTYAAVAGLLASVALTASYLPARRATRFDPAGALRSE